MNNRYQGLRAADKDTKLDQVIAEMADCRDASDLSDLYHRGYAYAVGSNVRKNLLRSSYDAAEARIEAI